MSAYTKGPWQVHSEHNPWLVVANIDGPDDERYSFDTICDCDQDSSTRLDSDETKANARLIAAAPELLEALKALTEDAVSIARHSYSISGQNFEDEFRAEDPDQYKRVQVARAAIAKAEGK